MGIYSDNFEKIRENPLYQPIDTVNLFSSDCRLETYQAIKDRLAEEMALKTAEKRRGINKKLITNYRELQVLQSIYRLEDKTVCAVFNHNIVSTAWVQDIIKLLQENSNNASRQVNNLCYEIKCQLGENIRINITQAVCEEDVRGELLRQIIDSVLRKIKSCSPLETSQCRYIIKDCAGLIRYLQNENYAWPDTKVFTDYIEGELDAVKGSKCCQNCGGKLYKNIPYCTRCYERNV